MKIDFDSDVDAAYLQLENSKIVDSQEIEPGIIFDFNERGSVVGVEIIGVKKKNLCHLLSLKIPFHRSDGFKAFENFLRKHLAQLNG